MGRIEKFEDLEVWQLARTICKEIENLFGTTPLGKNFSLRDQMERSSGSIMDNIAEGFGRDGNREFHNFLSYSKASCSELKSQLYRALDKKLIHEEQIEHLQSIIDMEINKIGAFMFYLRKSEFKGQKFKSLKKDNKP
ncbi:four helix bundle protein [Flagellimonas alvinocaridis]|uniref:Four helix bundle protein n=1 Tax=Flagellimonas alvinocaridis TaxID=2530200 RepID=A0A4V4HXM6_9FLAO|nr:four helix bundle protein [Allomuricauda alvinocaridis]THV61656.1 four helix bundle protein [Allomuricauda alvinocaridis]